MSATTKATKAGTKRVTVRILTIIKPISDSVSEAFGNIQEAILDLVRTEGIHNVIKGLEGMILHIDANNTDNPTTLFQNKVCRVVLSDAYAEAKKIRSKMGEAPAAPPAKSISVRLTAWRKKSAKTLPKDLSTKQLDAVLKQLKADYLKG